MSIAIAIALALVSVSDLDLDKVNKMKQGRIKRFISGMSLLEVVIAIGILGIVMTTTFSALNGLVAARTQAKDFAAYQKYLPTIHEEFIDQFKTTYKANTDAWGHYFPQDAGEIQQVVNGFVDITNQNIGYNILLQRNAIDNIRGTAANTPVRLGCWQDPNLDGVGCSNPNQLHGNGNNEHYEFCVFIDPINPVLFRLADDLLRMNPVIRYEIQLQDAFSLTNLSPADVNQNLTPAVMRVTYAMNWYNRGVSTSTNCKHTEGVFYINPY